MTTCSSKDEIAYKNYRKQYKKVLHEAEQNYYCQQFDIKTNSVRQIWRNLNCLASFSKTIQKICIPKLTVNGAYVTDQKDICDVLNDYFCNIGPILAQNINCQTSDFLKYCHPPVKNSV